MNDHSSQQDELSALSSIYGEDFVTVDTDSKVYRVEIRPIGIEPIETKPMESFDSDKIISFEFKLPNDYPSHSPPSYMISAPWMARDVKSQLIVSLDQIYQENIGEPLLYLWIEKARDCLNNEILLEQCPRDDDVEDVEDSQEEVTNNKLDIVSGEPFMDRKSTFQAHGCLVTSLDEVNYVVNQIKQNKKTCSATHNLSAYRIRGQEDYDDDGETAAGSRLLHLLQLLDVQNVVVVVSRWFGGIKLGPDRFKHINNVSRNLLQEMGLIQDKKSKKRD